jgi:hypothetical protein
MFSYYGRGCERALCGSGEMEIDHLVGGYNTINAGGDNRGLCGNICAMWEFVWVDNSRGDESEKPAERCERSSTAGDKIFRGETAGGVDIRAFRDSRAEGAGVYHFGGRYRRAMGLF